jgi:hypothetical protein
VTPSELKQPKTGKGFSKVGAVLRLFCPRKPPYQEHQNGDNQTDD